MRAGHCDERQRWVSGIVAAQRWVAIALVVRDRFSEDTWRILQRLEVDSKPRTGRLQTVDAVSLLNALIVDLAAFSGMEMENMTRGHGWRFLSIGRRLERAINLITLAQAATSADLGSPTVLNAVLEIADSTMTYRRRYFSEPQWPTVLDLICPDATNPRSLAFQCRSISEHIANLPNPSGNLRGPLE